MMRERASLARAAQAGRNLIEAALHDLIDRHGHAIALADLPWLGGLLRKVRQGASLAEGEIARVSAIRGELARAYHGR